ncbi:MAG: SUMF1/EgtB/PvdO family nonheme iron enzyme, partial [Chloroflexia bacterium]|nr:SUMF1/EgtB/PvdO family nonheme iron enzyme [Chloroflexia bacterium]
WMRLNCADTWAGRNSSLEEWSEWIKAIPTEAGPTAVCTYSQGVGPEGLWDGAGNVWEWLVSEFGPGRPALRGGSWDLDRVLARCSYRGRLDPGNRDGYVGVRVLFAGSPENPF